MDIHLKAFANFLSRLPNILKPIADVVIDTTPCVFDVSGKRTVSEEECRLRGLTYACTVVDRKTFKLIMQIPMMLQNGTFLIKGQYRVVMLRQVRACVPVQLKNAIAVFGGKIIGKKFMPGFTNDAISFETAEEKFGFNTAMLNFISSENFEPFDPLHADNMRILTCFELLSQLVQACCKNALKFSTWQEQMVTASIFSCMATGNWRGTSMIGVTQLANTTSKYALDCQLRLVVNNCSNNAARYVHPSTCGFFCVSDTPEGQNVGLTHTLIPGVVLTEEQHLNLADVGFEENPDGPLHVFLNGKYYRCEGEPKQTENVRFDVRSPQEIWVWCDAGRMQHATFTPRDIVSKTAQQIPFMSHNQTPRVSYYCNMAKQAMVCEKERGTGHKLAYAQKAAVQPCHDNASGVNVVLAVMAMGWNQEDALVFSQGAIDRGLFMSLEHKEHNVKIGGTHENLDDDGVVSCGIHLKPGDPIAVDKVSGFTARVPQRSADVVMVDDVVVAPEENKAIVKTVAMRKPQIGDKFVSRFGQKGVIGAIMKDENMPFTAEGIRPDVVINPHAWPSRMTVGQIMEMAGAKINIMQGKHNVDGTPWKESHTVQQLADALKECGQPRSGKERMYDGITGCMLQEPIFIAVCYYQRLSHLAKEKCYARGKTGPTNQATLQPTKGRKQAGGIRLGEMERDVLLSNGAMGVLHERNCTAGTTVFQNSQVPHASKLLMAELNAMCIKTDLFTI